MSEISKAYLGRGWAFPLAVEPQLGGIASEAHEKDVEQSIHIILSTSKGERVMRPDFGCGIHDLVFGAVNTALISRVEQEVTEALRTFEARIEVERVRVDASRAERGVLMIELDYRLQRTNQRGNFVYPFYFKEAF